jgi:hypothetical protein
VQWVDADPRTAVSSFRSILTVQEGEVAVGGHLAGESRRQAFTPAVILFIALPLSDDKRSRDDADRFATDATLVPAV